MDVINAIIATAAIKYALKTLFTVDQVRYKNEAMINLEASNVEAINTTAANAPANNFDNPTIEKNAAHAAKANAIIPTNIFNMVLFIRLQS